MSDVTKSDQPLLQIATATGETPLFRAGDRVSISERYPIGHYRVPRYIRAKQGTVELVIEPAAIDNEEEGFGKNAGTKLHYYRIRISLSDLWPGYSGVPGDGLLIEVYESWLERIQ